MCSKTRLYTVVSTRPDRSLALAAIALVSLLSAASGAVDAVAYLRYDVFVANQTGNLVIIALGITETGQRSALLPSLVSFGTFLAVIIFLLFIRRRWPNNDWRMRRRSLLIEAVMFTCAAFLIWFGVDKEFTLLVIALLAASQGIQAVTLTRALGVAVQTVAINGPLVTGANLAARGQWWRSAVAMSAPVAYALGAALGALLLLVASGAALLATAILTIIAVFVGQWYETHQSRCTEEPDGNSDGDEGNNSRPG